MAKTQKKCVTLQSNMNLKEKYAAFRAWQKRPYTVAPLSEESHECSTCGTRFQGNYCPRCGQSAIIGRYSFKKAFLLFLDVWGIGNRGMFRTLRDLLLRPGYMIRDYLSGMQMAYFPPFKMFFLLTTVSLLVSSGFNLQGRNIFIERTEEITQSTQAVFNVDSDKSETAQPPADSAESPRSLDAQKQFDKTATDYMNMFYKYPSIMSLVMWVLLSFPLYLFFRHSPSIPDMRYSEMLIAVIYTSNMLIIYSIVCDFFCLDTTVEYATQLLSVVAMKQFTGYSWWRTLVLLLIGFVVMILGVVLVMMVFSLIYTLLFPPVPLPS